MENQSKPQSLIDPSYLKKGVSLPKKHFSFLTVFLLFILGASIWVFLISVNILPNPYYPSEINEVFAPTAQVKGVSIVAEVQKNIAQVLLDFFLGK